MLRQLGDIQASEPGQTDFSPAKQFYVDADKRFQEALGESGNQSPFAQVGRARVKISEARMFQIGRRTDLSKQALDQAQSQLEKTIATYPKFAVARQTLGDALDESGQRERAVAAYSQATQLDPQNATAYFKVASTLDRLGRTDQARAYYGTYARVEIADVPRRIAHGGRGQGAAWHDRRAHDRSAPPPTLAAAIRRRSPPRFACRSSQA